MFVKLLFTNMSIENVLSYIVREFTSFVSPFLHFYCIFLCFCGQNKLVKSKVMTLPSFSTSTCPFFKIYNPYLKAAFTMPLEAQLGASIGSTVKLDGKNSTEWNPMVPRSMGAIGCRKFLLFNASSTDIMVSILMEPMMIV